MSSLSLSEIVLKFHQDGDSDTCYGETQELNVRVIDAGGGPYLIIKTDRWAFDQPVDLFNLLNRVQIQVFPLFESINTSESDGG